MNVSWLPGATGIQGEAHGEFIFRKQVTNLFTRRHWDVAPQI